MQQYPKSVRLSTSNASATLHGVERILERSARAPSWLEQVLQSGQFARLKPRRPSSKHYVLVYDILTDTYLVPVLGRNNAVVTVLTLPQYENTHGTIPPVVLQLAQAARIQTVAPEPAKRISPVERLAMRQTAKWRRPWFVTMRLTPSPIRKSEIRICTDVLWRQLCVQEVFDQDAQTTGVAQEVKELTFPAQAQLLARSPKFIEWVAKQVLRHGAELDDLLSVDVSWGRKPPIIDLTEVLLSRLLTPSK